MDTWLHLACLMKIKEQSLDDASSSRATWQNQSASSLIKHTRINGEDSHPSILFELLIEDEEEN